MRKLGKRCAVLWLALALSGLFVGVRRAEAAVTYCVGGFEISGGYATRRACSVHAATHAQWHFHMLVMGPDGKCRECWDEEDNTCETDFLAQHPEFGGRVNRFECARAGAAPPETAQIRVENGSVVSGPPGAPPGGVPGAPPGGIGPSTPPEVAGPPPPPPPPPRVNLNAEIEKVSAGPHAAGDSVRVTAQVTTGSGRVKAAQDGDLVVRGPDGKERMRVRVRPQANGQVTADLKIPDNAVGNLQLEFVPRGIQLAPDEVLGSVRPKQFNLKIATCRLRGHITSPSSGEVVLPQTLVPLTGELKDKSGAPVTSSALTTGTKVLFVAERADGKIQKHSGFVDAAGKVTGGLMLTPTNADSEDITVRLIAEGGVDGDLCPAGAVTLRLTKLGIGLAIVDPKPDGVCYTGKPCKVVAQFQLPSGGAARANAETWTRNPALGMIVKLNSVPISVLQPTTLPSGQRVFTGTFTPKFAAQTEIAVVARAGGQEVSDTQRVTIKDPIVLKLPSELDLGRVPAGSSWRINCQTLDFAGSRGVEEQEFLMQVELPPGCKSALGIVDGAGRFLPVGATKDGERRLTLGIDRSVKVCLEPPRCAGETPSPALMTVKATSPDFPAEEAKVRVIWKVTGRNFLLCNLWWLGILGGGLFLLFIVLGFIRPYQFGIDDSVKIATKKEGLQRAVARRLRDLPGGKAGFYRSAATGLRDDGSATDRLRTAQLTLHAYRGEVMIRCKGSLLRMNPQTRKLDPVEVPAEGYAASRNTVYQVGTLFFQVS